MKCLVIGPKYNGVANIIKVHKKYLEHLGVSVDWYGFKDQTFELNEIINGAEKLLNKIDFSKYDIIDCHIGMYEPEQILMLLLVNYDLPPRIFSVHNISFEMFKKMGFPKLQRAINNTIPKFFNSFIFYGDYPQKYFKEKYGRINSTKIYIPPTHVNSKIPNILIKKFEDKYSLLAGSYIGIIGYPSKWKNWKLLLRSFKYVDKQIDFVFAGPWWDKKLGFTKKIINKVSVRVIPDYLQGSDYTLFIRNSRFGVFPYTNYPTFQGSGTLSNYIWHGKPAVVSESTSLPEYIKDAGIILNDSDPKKWGRAISYLLNDKNLSQFEVVVNKRKELFAPEVYANKVFDFYKKIIKNKL